MKFIHNIPKWFGTEDALLNYFEGNFNKNTIGKFKVPSSTLTRFNNFADDIDKWTIINNLGEIAIDVIASSPKGKKLRNIPWARLETDTQDKLKEGVCEMIQHMILNRTIWEKVNSSSVQTPTFSMSSDLVSWLLSADMVGHIARTSLEASGINEYDWLFYGEMIQETANGNIKVIAKADLDTLPEVVDY